MTTFTQYLVKTFHVVNCAGCGAAFGINDSLYLRAVIEKQRSVYCPSCGVKFHWEGKTPVQTVREEMQRKLNVANSRADNQEVDARRQKKRAEIAVKSLSATKGVVTKMKNRVSKGACPVPGCKRSFDKSRLERHIKSKHPDYCSEE